MSVASNFNPDPGVTRYAAESDRDSDELVVESGNTAPSIDAGGLIYIQTDPAGVLLDPEAALRVADAIRKAVEEAPQAQAA